MVALRFLSTLLTHLVAPGANTLASSSAPHLTMLHMLGWRRVYLRTTLHISPCYMYICLVGDESTYVPLCTSHHAIYAWLEMSLPMYHSAHLTMLRMLGWRRVYLRITLHISPCYVCLVEMSLPTYHSL